MESLKVFVEVAAERELVPGNWLEFIVEFGGVQTEVEFNGEKFKHGLGYSILVRNMEPDGMIWLAQLAKKTYRKVCRG